MRKSSTSFIAVVLAAGLLLFGPGASAATIDDFSDQYPPNPDLPVSGRQIIFVGSTCDGSACPPGSMVSHLTSDQAYQTGLAGVMGGTREATISYVTGTANSNIYGPGNMLTFNHNAGASSILEIVYGGTGGLSADLTADGSVALIVDVSAATCIRGRALFPARSPSPAAPAQAPRRRRA